MKPRRSERLTLVRDGDGLANSGSAFTTYGCESPAGITSHRTPEAQLLELLNDLERKVEALESKYLEVLDTYILATTHLVRLLPFITGKDTTDVRYMDTLRS